jgi:superfamily II DNA or RNA helicase
MISLTLINKNKQAQITAEPSLLDLIREHFSAANPAYRRNGPRFQASRIYSITPQGKFEIGLLGEIINFLTLGNYPYKIDADLKNLFNPGIKEPIVENLNKPYRDYQEKSIFNALRQGRGVTVIPTAGGKTLIMAGIIKSLSQNNSQKTLVIVPSIQLVEQTASDFESYGLNSVSKWSGDNKYNPESSITVAGSQILMSDKTDLSVLADIDTLLVDEVHSVKRGNKINDVLKFINTSRRFGFTGTMPTYKIDQWNIIGKMGPITYEEKTVNLKQQSYVSNFQIIILNVKHSLIPSFTVDIGNPVLAYQREMEFLMNNQRRNNIITNLAFKLKENTLIMVDRIEHGVSIHSILLEINEKLKSNRPIYFIQGETEMVEREKIRSLMDERRDVIIVAISKIFSTGINIPNLHNIVFASIGKAKIKIMQSIGRVLRLHPTKSMATIFDIADNTKYGLKHVEERKKMYNLEKYEYTEKEIS